MRKQSISEIERIINNATKEELKEVEGIMDGHLKRLVDKGNQKAINLYNRLNRKN